MIVWILALVFYLLNQSQKSTIQKVAESWVMAWIVVWIALQLAPADQKESFFFQVTPWKRTCGGLRQYRCPQCCPRGFPGIPVGFEYTGDRERMNMQVREPGTEGACPIRSRESLLPNRASSYATQSETYRDETQ
jgi:hypothetical protein